MSLKTKHPARNGAGRKDTDVSPRPGVPVYAPGEAGAIRRRARHARPAAGFALLLCLAAFAAPPRAHAGMPVSNPALKKARATGTLTPATPETRWAKPLAGGPVRVLAVAPRFTLRDISELALRLDLSCETVGLWDATHAGCDPVEVVNPPNDALPEAVIGSLRDKLGAGCDVLVLGNLDSAVLPPELLSDIIDRVAGGMGLVVAHLRDGGEGPLRTFVDVLEADPDAEPLRRGVGETGLAGWEEGAEPGRVLRHGKGRVVVLDYPGDPPKTHFLIQPPADPLDMDPVFLENAYAYAARAVLAAARRVPAARIAEIADAAPAGPAAEEIPPDFTPEFVQSMRDSMAPQPVRPFVLKLAAPAGERCRMAVQIRRPGTESRIVYSDATVLPKGADSYAFDMIVGPGRHFIDAWLYDGEKVVDWHTQAVTLSGWPEFGEVKYDKTWMQPNDTLRVSLEVRPVFNQSRACTIHARATDTWGRLVASAARAVSSEGGPVELRLHFTDLLSPLLKVEVYAVEGDAGATTSWDLHRSLRTYRYISVRLPKRPPDMSLVALMDTPGEYNQEAALRTLAGLGVDCAHAAAGEAAMVRVDLQGLAFVPELDRFAVDRASDGLARRPCLSDGEYLRRTAGHLAEQAVLHWAGGGGRYSLGNGNCVCASEENVCQAPESMAAFAAWLQRAHGGLDALNSAWGAAFTDWSRAVPAGLDAARGGGSPAPWVDFRRFMDETFAGFHGMARQAVRGADRQGECGFRALGDANPVHGYWWPALVENTDYIAADWDPVVAAKLRSYGRRGSWNGIVLSGADGLESPARAGWLPWHAAFSGLASIWVDGVSGTADQPLARPLLDAAGAPDPLFGALARAVGEVRAVAPLLREAAPEPATVLVYDSHASRHFNDADTAFGASAAAQRAWAELLDGIGAGWAFIDAARLGALQEGTARALVLPLCRALDDTEISAIQAFAARGGLVIADVAPGSRDGHGVRRTPPALDALFGVAREGADAVVSAPLQWTAQDQPAPAGFIGGAGADGSARPDTAQALGACGACPVWLRQAPDRGRALLLNHVPRPRAAGGRDELPAEYLLVEAALAEAGAAPVWSPGGESRFYGRVSLFRFGEARLVALLADPAAPVQKLRLPFAKDDTVVDLRAGAGVRRPKDLKVALEPGQAALYAVVPGKTGGVTVRAAKSAGAGQRLPVQVAVGMEKGAPGLRMVALELVNGDGVSLPWYRRTLRCESGAGEAFIPLARNEAPGVYTVRAKDLLSGAAGEAAVQVNPPAEQ